MSAVEFEVRDGIGIITFNRPESRNSLDAASMDGLRAAFARVVSEPEIRVAVLTGAGGTFCSGMDLKAFARGEPMDHTGLPLSAENPLFLEKPTVAAVEGHCLAGGFEVALSCDQIVASAAARFGLPEVRRGLVAAGGGLVRLPRQAPWRVALELALTGEIVTADRLQRLGVINRIAPEGQALDVALELARTIAGNGPLAVATSKRLIVRSVELGEVEAMKGQTEIVAPVFASDDAREGSRAFAEKRDPVWTGR